MADARNILIHNYDRVSAEILTDIIRDHIPALLAAVKRLLGEEMP